MKYLIVAAIVGAILFLLYLRLRPYINAARRVLAVFREARAMSAGQATPNAARRKRTDAEERLVRCASCGTWLPASRALTLRSTSSTFCSHACLERSAGTESTHRTAGSQR
ncbi:MAG TPA: hypothetical protein VJ842_14450 [Pyrinomonadaceae bacterium]|nr:hypothetical protein [Pyrinomonadaceae bacterium]